MSNFRDTPNAEDIPVSIVDGSNFNHYAKISSSMTQNLYINQDWLVSFPGYKRAASPPVASRGRGLFISTRSNVMVAIVGSGVYVVTPNLAMQFVDNLATQSTEISMDENLNNQICIVDGLNAYILNLVQPYTLTIQSGGPIGSNLIPNYVTFHDTFFLLGNANTTNNGAQWYAFSYATPTTIAVTTQLALQTKPDYAIAVKAIPSQSNNVLVFGTTVCEIHQNVGGIQNYRRNSSVNIDFGCRSVGTIASSDKYIAWLGTNQSNSPVIMVFEGTSAAPISTDGIDYVLGRIKFPGQSTALFYKKDGHLFYQLTFFNAQDDLTLVYDFNTQKFFHLTDQFESYHPALDVVYFNLASYFISIRNGSIYKIDTDITVIDENLANPLSGNYNDALVYDIPRTRITENISRADSSRFVANSFVFTIDQGNDPAVTGLSIAQGYPNLIITEDEFVPPNAPIITEQGDYVISEELNSSPTTEGPNELAKFLPPAHLVYRPRVDMSISKDSGITFGNTVSRYLNPIGERKNILTFNKLGLANVLTIKLRFWGRGSVVVSNGIIEAY